jgi:vacuolar-type H+-ATPase subunit F/Vma7
MAEIVVVGKEEFTLGFMLVGIKRIINDIDKDSTINNLKALLEDENVGIIILQQETFDNMPITLREKLVKSVKPVVVLLSKDGDSGNIREMIIKSIGVDLWEK